jgi:hypothetical protein
MITPIPLKYSNYSAIHFLKKIKETAMEKSIVEAVVAGQRLQLRFMKASKIFKFI